ncbi:MAG: tRNA pseudouridine(13) synthase TruD [Arcobacteraceae bacterium]|nr:tRNA pseudouridine(13) synthase TruD [Arcobacteraceae bacterium]
MNINKTRTYLQTHNAIDFTFVQNKFDFIVDEVPLEEFSGKGNFLILRIKKEFLSTWELISTIVDKLGIEEHKIGYAGLKDKKATTTQYISIPLMKEQFLKPLNSKKIKILSVHRHHKKLNIGDLKGNKFKITLKNVEDENLPIIYQTLSQIQKNGMPNYFGYQRFGKDYDFQKAKDVVFGEEVMANKKLEHLLISAYQSYFFNAWLAKRIELSKDKGLKRLEFLDGDIYSLKDKKTITGLLPGRKVPRSTSEAGEIEKEFDDMFVYAKGFRRDAWVYPKNIKNKYLKEYKNLILEFELPKSSYATVLIENIANKNFK